MFRRGPRTAVKEAVNAQAEALLSLGGWHVREGTVLVAQTGDDVVGVAMLRLGARDAEVLTVITDANHRHRGVGRALMQEMVRRARLAGCRRLHVRFPLADDASAGFFRALGFEVTQVTLDLAL